MGFVNLHNMMNSNLTFERLTYKGAVLTNECDSNKHMNVMYYINKFELAEMKIVTVLFDMEKRKAVKLSPEIIKTLEKLKIKT